MPIVCLAELENGSMEGDKETFFFFNFNPKASLCFEQTRVNTVGGNKARYTEDRLDLMYEIRNVKKTKIQSLNLIF